jgi:uncharacterized membrane protein YuzA (DUF378 family)
MAALPGLLLLIAGICGVAPIDGRIAWVVVLIAGLVMVLPGV